MFHTMSAYKLVFCSRRLAFFLADKMRYVLLQKQIKIKKALFYIEKILNYLIPTEGLRMTEMGFNLLV